jgi:hypothetical protein
MKQFFFVFLFLYSTNSIAWTLFGPKNYDECILQNMKGVTDKTAAELIMMSCLSKFDTPSTAKKCTEREFTRTEREHISSTARLDFTELTIDFHNGTKNLSIVEANVSISADNINPAQEYKLRFDYPISPLESGRAKTYIQKVPDRKSFKWYFTTLKTCS